MFTELIIHHSAVRDGDHIDASDYERWHRERGWRDIGYHFVIERVDGEPQVIAGRPLWMSGSHCPGHNDSAIGVCIAGDFTNEAPDDELLRFAASYVAGLAAFGLISLDRIYPHRHFRDTACPGDSFPWAEFLLLVSDAFDGREVG